MNTNPNRRLLIVPRWAGLPTSDYYPWLLGQLASAQPNHFSEIRIIDMPRPELPDVADWPAAISAALGTDPELLARTYLLGHSVGCQALLRALAKLPDGHRVAGALMVAGWWEIDQPWDSIRPWLEPVLELDRVRAAVAKLSVLLSNDDPFTADHAKNQRAWQDRLGAQVRIEAGGRHFNAASEPAVLSALLDL